MKEAIGGPNMMNRLSEGEEHNRTYRFATEFLWSSLGGKKRSKEPRGLTLSVRLFSSGKEGGSLR